MFTATIYNGKVYVENENFAFLQNKLGTTFSKKMYSSPQSLFCRRITHHEGWLHGKIRSSMFNCEKINISFRFINQKWEIYILGSFAVSFSVILSRWFKRFTCGNFIQNTRQQEISGKRTFFIRISLTIQKKDLVRVI